jgi:sec-independent protein translocase protein TatB
LFGIGSWEFVVIVVLALLLFGPDKLPDFARTIGRFMRDFRRYQAMMESTIKAEVFTADPKLQKDPFKTGKDFAEKVGSGGFTRPADTKAAAAADGATADEAAAADAAAVTGQAAAPSAAVADAASDSTESAAPPTNAGEEGPEQA